LGTLTHAPKNKEIHSIIDSQSTIDGVNCVLKKEGDSRLYKTLANHSILKSIADNIRERNKRGFQVHLIKVASHTGLQDANSLLNVRADKAADEGRHIPIATTVT
jgi:hypothetical protein